MLKPEWEAKHAFVETPCEIVSAKLIESRNKKGSLLYRPEFHVRYTVEGKVYEQDTYRIVKSSSSSKSSNQAVVDEFKVGGTYPCWYDPKNPTRVVVDRSFSVLSLVFTGIGAFLAGIAILALLVNAVKFVLAISFLAAKK
ncbi:MAG: DUF3592 domain-containing protein [Verrucomicrobia bacterium]|nr:DUF3592 domain-containing protein [Verrucomicrobiota bacterium]